MSKKSQVEIDITLNDKNVKKDLQSMAKEAKKNAGTVVEAMDKATHSIEESGHETKQTGKEIEDTTRNAGENFEEMGESARQMGEDTSDSAKPLEELRESTEKTNQSVERSQKSFINWGSAVKLAIAGVVTVAATAFGAIAAGTGAATSFGIEYKKASNDIQAQTGATKEEMEGLSDAMKQVYADNFGEDMNDVAEAIATVKKNLGGTDDEIRQATEEAIAFRDTFGYEVPESTRAASALIKHFGVDAKTAYDLMAKGAQNGLDYSGELIDNIDEYSVQFAKAGLSANEMFNIMAAGYDAGSWNLDKIGDAVKELNIRLVDGSDTTKAGLEAIGMNADEVAKKMSKGGETAKKTYKQVVDKLADMDDQQARNIAGVNLFGTMWEDLGPEVVAQLAVLEGAYDDVSGTMDKINDVKYDDAKSALEALKRKTQVSLLLPISEDIMPAISGATDAAIGYIDQLANAYENHGVNGLLDEAGEVFAEISVKAAAEAPRMVEAAVDFVENTVDGLAAHKGELVEAGADMVKTLAGAAVKILPTELQRPVKEAVNDIVDSFTGGGIKRGAQTFGKIFENGFKVVSKVTKTVLPPFTKAVDKAADNMDTLIPLVVAGATAFKTYSVVSGVVCSKRLLNQAVGKSLRTHNLKPKKGAQVMRKNEKITALYERLSRDDFGKDDDQQRESNSISNQKAMLEEFAARQGFTNIVHFTDDGISGTCFDRPGFLAMMKEVEAGNVEYLCIKDMSRMGRDYLKVGQIMEILRQRGVRLIAINDGVDSARGDDDFTPFRNIMNEYYARDTSRKIRSTFQSKGKSGKHLTGTVIYGYLWNEARDQWLVDPEAAEVVKRIFAMTIDGYGPYQIASKLKEEKVLIPSAYLARHGEGVNKNKTFKDVYGWGSSTICNILEKREYLGHTINFKTRKHFKDKKSHYVPEDEWTIFENTHEAIIDQQTFDLVQKIRGNVRRYPDGWGEAAPLTGLLYCADCGGKMYVHRTNNGKRISQYTCSQYSKVPVGKLCTTQHRINEDVVLSLVSEMLKAIAEYAKHDRAEFVRVVQEAQSSQQTAEVKKQRIRLATAKQRVSELEVLLCKIYEDNILGKLSDSRYATLDAQYEKEQTELTAEISVLEKAVKSYEKHEKDADRFIALIDKYENFDKLTIAMLNEFIEKILVHERDRKGSIQTTQEVEIYFNFVGRFVPPAFGEVELTPEELEEIRKREERKDRLHQNYLKRKASGAQKRYEDKIKKRKKAEIEAKKAAIRAEDIAKGVFVPVSSLPQREPMKGVQTA